MNIYSGFYKSYLLIKIINSRFKFNFTSKIFQCLFTHVLLIGKKKYLFNIGICANIKIICKNVYLKI